MKWRCTRCGKLHAQNDSPCTACGHTTFERATVRVDEGAESGQSPDSAPTGTVDTGPEYVWVCSNCGRQHVRNSPPCSRCGSPDLEKGEQTYDGLERDLTAPGWLDVAMPYLPILAGIALLIALFATGIASPSLLPGIGPPTPPDAPGQGAEAAGIDLEATEREVHERLESERLPEERRRFNDGLAAYAEYQNRGLVAVEFDNAEPNGVSPDEFDHSCGDVTPVGAPLVTSEISINSYDDGGAFATDVADALLSSRFEEAVRSGYDAEGIDIHVAPNGDIYVFYAVC
ncbi:zinc-ribbon domain-containing protein [Natrinema gelatinilyticum]|uniref:zinc-ribbon domain-containing protein n=1 Tax=Natrinema gelatinilyticum TaxID=2961571 RepID=UPI0020C24FE9|nr:zinc-ribbon domain-containing protein [Natrinema gelatinilyticum]